VFLFYRNKLKHPIAELELASQNISQNNLCFHITYENKDEMGRLCREFEQMRAQLYENNIRLWRSLEEERALRAAISHDLRSPLSVLKGYHEMLTDYLPDETIDAKRAMEMLAECGKQLDRMDAFVETMRKLSSLEKRELLSCEITAEQLHADLLAECHILEKEAGRQITLQAAPTAEVFRGDREIILEVTENLLSNALRHAKKEVTLTFFVTGSECRICVTDDGNGFPDNTADVTKAFYQQNAKDSLKHAGMGMYISRLYCEKHGGRLLIGNQKQSGACVTAIFCRIA
ncbi:MAG: HAMP domain-containing histidine kinase, partial [Lachnospiraceae bacterium]|nr:HAMP domain-containing histidine kinase [Lachnospiraceae bacterium]